MKKKVLYITTVSGFLPQFLENDVKLIQHMGYEVHYASNFYHPVYYFDKKELEAKGIILHQINIEKSPARLGKNVQAILQLRRIIDEEEINMIHCHNPMGGAAGRCAAKISRQRPYVIYTAHGFHFYKGAPVKNWLCFYPVERFLARWTDALVTINGEDYLRAADFHLNKGGFVKQIHGVGVDLQRFHHRPELVKSKRKELGIPEKAFHIVTAAELNENKNQRVVIEAIEQMKNADIYYSICGTGPEKKILEKLIKQKHLEQYIRLLGYRTDMEEILQTADVFAFPSLREGLGIAAVEALACEVPLIVADNRGTREYAEDGGNGIVCPAENVVAFRRAIEYLYGDAEYRSRLSRECRQTAERFSIQETAIRMQEIYRKADQASSLQENIH